MEPRPTPEGPLSPEVVLHQGHLALTSFQLGLMAQTEHNLCMPHGPRQVKPWVEQTKQVAWGLPMGGMGQPTVRPLQPPDEHRATQACCPMAQQASVWVVATSHGTRNK